MFNRRYHTLEPFESKEQVTEPPKVLLDAVEAFPHTFESDFAHSGRHVSRAPIFEIGSATLNNPPGVASDSVYIFSDDHSDRILEMQLPNYQARTVEVSFISEHGPDLVPGKITVTYDHFTTRKLISVVSLCSTAVHFRWSLKRMFENI